MQRITNISELPDDIRSLAEYNREHHSYRGIDNDTDNINLAFEWASTPQGHEYWSEIFNGEEVINSERYKPTQTDDQIIM